MEAADLEGHTASKGALKFPVDRPLSSVLVGKLIAARLTELSAGSRLAWERDGTSDSGPSSGIPLPWGDDFGDGERADGEPERIETDV